MAADGNCPCYMYVLSLSMHMCEFKAEVHDVRDVGGGQ